MIDGPKRQKRRIEPLDDPKAPIGDLLAEAQKQAAHAIPETTSDVPTPADVPQEPTEPEEQEVPESTPEDPKEEPIAQPTDKAIGPDDPMPEVPPTPSFRHRDPLIDDLEDSAQPSQDQPKRKHRHRLHEWWQKRSKKQKIAVGVVVALIILAEIGGGVYWFFLRNEPTPPPAPKQTAPKVVKPTTEASKLSGLQVAPEVNKRPVTGVMIENSISARPQSGLYDASVVFEAIAEGGITRFLALFQDTQPTYVGPVRSARPYYIQWLQGFDATYAHVGGSPEALQYVKKNGIKDLDQFHNSSAYQRVSSRYAPHNVYTSIPALVKLAEGKGYKTSNFTGLARKTAAPSKTPTATQIDLDISGANYKVRYTYDSATNTYARVLAGKPHTDEKAGKQIAPNIVVGLVMNYSIQADGVHSAYNVVGSGQACIFQDGVVTKATWKKASAKEQITFTDAEGKAIGLNPGKTWITALKSASNITYTVKP